jgi:thiol:disulfide interchange protein
MFPIASKARRLAGGGDGCYHDGMFRGPSSSRVARRFGASFGAVILLVAAVIGGCTFAAKGDDGEPPAATARASNSTEPQGESQVRSRAPTEIRWVPYDQAFAVAGREHKPVVLMFTAGWCGHCRTYRDQVLTNAQVIEMSSRFVMVRVDIDERRDLNQRYGIDGGYVPRTMFFTPEGTHRPELRAERPSYVYFLNTGNPVELLGLMQRAIGS